MGSIVLGVTGTRHNPTTRQVFSLYRYMLTLHDQGCNTLHHGCCTGWDTVAHYLAASLGWHIVLRPGPAGTNGLDKGYRRTTVLVEKPNRMRNQDIVNAATELVAGPAAPESDARSKRSGTWMTIRMATKSKKSWIAFLPDGSVLNGERV